MTLSQIQNSISLLHIGFVTCVVLALVFLGLTIAFFFRLGILQILQQKTGWTAKRALIAFNEQNSRTSGSLKRGNSVALGERTPVNLPSTLPTALPSELPAALPGRASDLTIASLAALPTDGSMSGDSDAEPTIHLSSRSIPQGALSAPVVLVPGFTLTREVLIVHTDVEI
ncbi:MAG: hypothetical protein LBO07_01200 [Coriobacteriales bacterium]|jgi:hypothetical protein|nr:hypothetical protein [Coriobacteriales bacterium]